MDCVTAKHAAQSCAALLGPLDAGRLLALDVAVSAECRSVAIEARRGALGVDLVAVNLNPGAFARVVTFVMACLAEVLLGMAVSAHRGILLADLGVQRRTLRPGVGRVGHLDADAMAVRAERLLVTHQAVFTILLGFPAVLGTTIIVSMQPRPSIVTRRFKVKVIRMAGITAAGRPRFLLKTVTTKAPLHFHVVFMIGDARVGYSVVASRTIDLFIQVDLVIDLKTRLRAYHAVAHRVADLTALRRKLFAGLAFLVDRLLVVIGDMHVQLGKGCHLMLNEANDVGRNVARDAGHILMVRLLPGSMVGAHLVA